MNLQLGDKVCEKGALVKDFLFFLCLSARRENTWIHQEGAAREPDVFQRWGTWPGRCRWRE